MFQMRVFIYRNFWAVLNPTFGSQPCTVLSAEHILVTQSSIVLSAEHILLWLIHAPPEVLNTYLVV